MKKTIYLDDFRNEFVDYGRQNQFSSRGLEALFDYLEEMEVDEYQYELDVVALCCEFAEYNNLEELMESYPEINSMDDLRDKTEVITFDNGKDFEFNESIIIVQF